MPDHTWWGACCGSSSTAPQSNAPALSTFLLLSLTQTKTPCRGPCIRIGVVHAPHELHEAVRVPLLNHEYFKPLRVWVLANRRFCELTSSSSSARCRAP
ncbi:hypothetical protein PR003_g17186 [Phytophthora rubi]|uniref:Uncharacterized protein n=1 Tax=Phytophthora rubi TaxID=129364 RepID=A0A6A3LSS2_9STRA|nr:hypothetical protein PR002_g12009 [Phytophthora rubi]KAE9028473.1 hypothetical protein PR001_g11733 [Phytophthora rubi]KAE9322613.1 hypothetical protein PR003_g17186 [Phytophthora rubi]